MSLELAAVEVIRCEADEGGDLLAAHLPEFWQQGDERDGQHRADAWHGGLRRAAGYVHKLLQGTKPADLPVELATKFDLAVNLKTAKSLGLELTPTFIARADEVIE